MKETHPFQDTRSSNHLATINLGASSYLKDHGLLGMIVLPGATYVEMITQAFFPEKNTLPFYIKDVRFERVFLIKEQQDGDISFAVEQKTVDGTARHFLIHANDKEQRHLPYASFSGYSFAQQGLAEEAPLFDEQGTIQRLNNHQEKEPLYARFLANGNVYDAAFQAIERIHYKELEVLAEISIPDFLRSDWNTYYLHPVLLDACLHATVTPLLDQGQLFYVKGIRGVELYAPITTESFAHSMLTPSEDEPGAYEADTFLYSKDHELLAIFRGIQVQQWHKDEKGTAEKTKESASQHVVVSATFTADPIAPVVSFWMKKWGVNAEVKLTPYNQPFQQLLDPGSELATNSTGFNTLLVRLEDWGHSQVTQPLHAKDSEIKAAFNGQDTYTLPNQIEIAHLNTYETSYLFEEIFTERAYLRHGITMKPGDCIIDVGANIGMFTLFALANATDARVYAFEPSPMAFKALNANASLYGKNVKAFNMGLADEDGEAMFTFYKRSSVFSSYHAEEDSDQTAIKKVIENALYDAAGTASDAQVAELTDKMIADRLEKETFMCPIRSLSSIIKQENIQKIDLLKVDVEKSELQVLKGIAPEHWPLIQQIVLEVHDTEGPVIEEVMSILKAQGFDLHIDEEELLKESGLYNIYGTRLSKEQRAEEQKVPSDPIERMKQSADDFIEALGKFDQRTKVPTLVSICTPTPEVAHLNAQLTEITNQIASEISALGHIHFVGTDTIEALYPVDRYHAAETNKLGHVPYTEEHFTAMGTHLVRSFQALQRKPYKVIVLDCDYTLWNGVSGEVGAQGIEISAPYRFLQNFMLAQQQAGMLLCLCSKNVEEDVLHVFEENKDMILQLDQVVAHKINWQAKSENIRMLAQELQLGLDSFIYIDDNPVECAEVRANCPEVLTLQLPKQIAHIPHFLTHQWAFDKASTTKEDAERTRMYKQNVEREQMRKRSLDFASFIQNLNLNIRISTPEDDDLQRVSQLTYRTNQFNFTTIRRPEADINALIRDGMQIRIVKVTDRFGDYGTVGVVCYKVEEEALVVDTLLLSCRVLGKGVEYRLLQYLGKQAEKQNKRAVHVPFVPTRKNKPAELFLKAISTSMEARVQENHKLQGPVDSSEPYTGTLYTFDSTTLSTLVYEPQRVSDANEVETASVKKPVSGRSEHQDKVLQDIADHYHSVEQIIAAVDASSKRKRPDSLGMYVQPAGELEQKIADIWAKVLSIDKVGTTDHFFKLGGTSLQAVQVIAMVNENLDAELAAVSLFDQSTIKELASLLGAHGRQSSGDGASTGAVELVTSQQTHTMDRERGSKRRNRVNRRRRK